MALTSLEQDHEKKEGKRGEKRVVGVALRVVEKRISSCMNSYRNWRKREIVRLGMRVAVKRERKVAERKKKQKKRKERKKRTKQTKTEQNRTEISNIFSSTQTWELEIGGRIHCHSLGRELPGSFGQ